MRAFGPRGERRELVPLVRRIQALTLEVHEVRRRDAATRELQARKRTLEQQRRRLASIARRTATDEPSWKPALDD